MSRAIIAEAADSFEVRVISIRNLMPGMILDEDIRTAHGALLVCNGVEITEMLLARLITFRERGAIDSVVRVKVC